MSIKDKLDQDIKQAMLAGDKALVTTLRGIKSTILYAEVASGSRQEGLDDEKIIELLSKEAKKRQESADLYRQGGNEARVAAELAEKAVIHGYLPEQLSDDELDAIVLSVIEETGATGPREMGQVIALVKKRAGATADGGRIAKIVKEKLN